MSKPTLISRRGVLRAAAAASALIACPAIAKAKPRVVVIGGGPGGATVAKYIARDSQGAIDVTMIEPQEKFITCFHSNLYLGDMRSFESISHGYKLGSYGVKHVRQFAAAIDRGRAFLVKVQNDDGSFGWFGVRGPGDDARGGP